MTFHQLHQTFAAGAVAGAGRVDGDSRPAGHLQQIFARGCGDERVRLGGVAVAGYGLSGSKKLQAGVRAAMEVNPNNMY